MSEGEKTFEEIARLFDGYVLSARLSNGSPTSLPAFLQRSGDPEAPSSSLDGSSADIANIDLGSPFTWFDYLSRVSDLERSAMKRLWRNVLGRPNEVVDDVTRLVDPDFVLRYTAVRYLNLLNDGRVGRVLVGLRFEEPVYPAPSPAFSSNTSATPWVVLHLDLVGTVRSIEGDFLTTLGSSSEDLLGTSAMAFIHPEDAGTVIGNWVTFVASGSTRSLHHRVVRRDGQIRWVSSKLLSRPSESAVLAIMEDITDRVVQPSSRAETNNYATIVDLFEHPVFLASFDGQITLVNRAFRDALHEVPGTISSLLRAADPDAWTSMLSSGASFEITRGVPPIGDQRLGLRPSLEYPVTHWRVRCHIAEAGDSPLLIGQLTDVTAEHDREIVLTDHAHHDELTGLLNRRGLFEHWEVLEGFTCVFFADVDGLKTVNDTMGHAAGDLLLRTATQRLRDAARPSDLLARVGGDEFVLVTRGVTKADDVAAITERLRAAVCGPFVVGAEVLDLSLSIGSVLCDAEADLAGVLAGADQAMYEEKRQRKTEHARKADRESAIRAASEQKSGMRVAVGP